MAIAPAEPPLQQLPSKDRAVFDACHVADEHLAHAARQRRRVVAHLIRVRQYNPLRGALALEKLIESGGKPIGGVRRQQWMLHAHHFA